MKVKYILIRNCTSGRQARTVRAGLQSLQGKGQGLQGDIEKGLPRARRSGWLC